MISGAYMVPHPPLIIPEVGRGEERKIPDTINAYHEVGRNIADLKPETIVLISPHQIMYADYFHISPGERAEGDFGQFGVSKVKMKARYDAEFVENLCRLAAAADLPAGTLGEREKKLDHGSLVPLYFVNKYWTKYRLVRVGLSGLSLTEHYGLGQLIQKTADALGKNTVIVASGDLSHRLKEDGPYGYQKEGPEYDRRIMEVMGRGEFGALLEFPEDFCEKAGECGHRSFTIMAGALDRMKAYVKRLSYEGTFGVGYGICMYSTCGQEPTRNFKNQYEERERKRILSLREQEDEYVRLARQTVEEYVRTGKKIQAPEGIAQEMKATKAGVFVSIKKEGRLRGCIGTIQAVRPSIAEEIIENAISAASRDPRFSAIEVRELDRLTITVDVLGDTEKIDSPGKLDVKRYGVVVTKGHKQGLLLPNLEGVDTVKEQIAIAKQKAGIGEHEKAELERFEVVRHY